MSSNVRSLSAIMAAAMLAPLAAAAPEYCPLEVRTATVTACFTNTGAPVKPTCDVACPTPVAKPNDDGPIQVYVQAPKCDSCGCDSCAHTNVYTTTYDAFCPTGLSKQEYVVTEVYAGMSAKPSVTAAPKVPFGFAVDVKTCNDPPAPLRVPRHTPFGLTILVVGLENPASLALAPAPDILVRLVLRLVLRLELKQGLKQGETQKDLAGTKEALRQARKQARLPGPLPGPVQTALKAALKLVLKPVLPQVPRRAQVHPALKQALKQGLKQELLPERPREPARTRLALRRARALGPLLGPTQKDLAQRRSQEQEQEQEQERRRMLDLELPYRPTRTTTRPLRHHRPRMGRTLPPLLPLSQQARQARCRFPLLALPLSQ
ncbi:hypothetical protein INS49_014567 [Diaporthe citri]|uniref:uncharacterized protein n=1 Tax=Diaporthe citri TaxID=83186 RepID=UPI001C7E3FDD|nr:uncharacterized protein INS49_014567 [Diaporthe citri]KAG6356693.1 hypothetical protein INS49_014567 [Diaporthe citri]